MPDVHTQTVMTGERIETVSQEFRKLRQAKYKRTYYKKKAATKRIVDQVSKRMAEHIVEDTKVAARRKARAPAASAFLLAIEDKVDVMGCASI